MLYAKIYTLFPYVLLSKNIWPEKKCTKNWRPFASWDLCFSFHYILLPEPQQGFSSLSSCPASQLPWPCRSCPSRRPACPLSQRIQLRPIRAHPRGGYRLFRGLPSQGPNKTKTAPFFAPGKLGRVMAMGVSTTAAQGTLLGQHGPSSFFVLPRSRPCRPFVVGSSSSRSFRVSTKGLHR